MSKSLLILALATCALAAFGEDEISGARRAGTMDQLNQVEQQILQNSDCVWVDRAADNAKTTRNVVGYQVRNCTNPKTNGPTIVCSGTVKCDVSMKTQSGGDASFTMFAEHVICSSAAKDSCPPAAKCLQEGGVLADMGIGDVLGIPEGGTKRYSPGKKPVKGQMHDN